MIKEEQYNPAPIYNGPINETERRIVLYAPPLYFSPPKPKVSFRRRRPAGFVTCISALLSMLTVTLILLNAVLLSEHIHPEKILLQMGSHAFFGIASVSVIPPDASFPQPPEVTLPEAESEAPPSPPAETDAPAPAVPQPEYPIVKADVSSRDIHALNNETDYSPDTRTLLTAPLPFPAPAANADGTQPYILILHTHGTESFVREGVDTYTAADAFRTDNTEENIVAVGAVMAETFKAAGIPVLHCTEMFDQESYQDSYSRAAAAIRTYLKEYPSIQIVLDVHRDSIIRADMTKIRPVTTVDGKDAAQFMIVVGTDFKGANHPDWTKNLSFALKIQENLIKTHPGLARAVNLRGAGFNQQYTDGSLLLEVGSCGNTLTEAKRAGILAATAIAEVISGQASPAGTNGILPRQISQTEAYPLLPDFQKSYRDAYQALLSPHPEECSHR